MSGEAADLPQKRYDTRDSQDLYLDQLDRQSGPTPADDRRRHERHRHRITEGLEVTFDAFDGQPVTCHVRPRNLSQGGIAFLHEAYVYPETRCTVALVSVTNQTVEVSGRVVGCRHVTGKLHEIAMTFDHPIEAEDFHECIREAMHSTEL